MVCSSQENGDPTVTHLLGCYTRPQENGRVCATGRSTMIVGCSLLVAATPLDGNGGPHVPSVVLPSSPYPELRYLTLGIRYSRGIQCLPNSLQRVLTATVVAVVIEAASGSLRTETSFYFAVLIAHVSDTHQGTLAFCC